MTPEGFAHDGDHGANADAGEGEAGDAGTPAAVLREDDGVGDEAEVSGGVSRFYFPRGVIQCSVCLTRCRRGEKSC